jgi:aryl-alcohol dehydrogenase-like predicted oxidoreductase
VKGQIMAVRRRLGETDLEVTPIGLGCWQFGGRVPGGRIFPAMDPATATAIVGAARTGGIDWFDTAEAYGRGESERQLAAALRRLGVRPGQVRVATKWAPWARTAGHIGRTIGDRLEALGGYPIDLYQIHQPVGGLSSVDAQIDAMADLVEAGQIRHVGVSNFGAARMERAHRRLRERGIALASNQVRINLLDRRIETNGVLATARRLGISLIGYSPLAQGVLTGRFHDDPDSLRRLSPPRRLVVGGRRAVTRSAALVEELRKIAAAHGVKPGQVALAWVIQAYGDDVVCIPGASRPEQAAESAQVLELELTAQELTVLNDY